MRRRAQRVGLADLIGNQTAHNTLAADVQKSLVRLGQGQTPCVDIHKQPKEVLGVRRTDKASGRQVGRDGDLS